MSTGRVFKVYREGQVKSLLLFYSPAERFGSLYLALEHDKAQKIAESWSRAEMQLEL